MRTYIWTLPTRIFHWFLAVGFAVAYILGDFDNLRNLHFAFGAFVGTLIVFRLLFGLFGPKYSNFKDFPIGLKNQKEFIKTYFSKAKTYAGHNPAASVIALFILLVGILCSISGYLLYATENNVLSMGINEEFLEESHEVMANLFLALVSIHILGVLADTLFHGKTGTLQSIFTGFKNIETKNTRLNGFHKIFSLLWLIIPFIIFYLAYELQINTKGNEVENNEYYKHDDD
ncbi:MAG: cytochrome b/b6 domain-containing protein [Flavobacteriaceae bacterium]|nr:cytochrome b/b6 domain-containing protein [Flavobacteriaceae bacterium]